jgi:serine/threonine protein kinase
MTPIEVEARSIFLNALDRSGDDLEHFLTAACASNDELRRRVEELVQAHREMGNIEIPTPDYVTRYSSRRDDLLEGPGTIIGHYRLLEKIGEGGFGIVYMAEQIQPVRRRVAFKIIKPGMDSRSVIARFEAERQALALMAHPNIAQVFDGGATETGRPFFVMELVPGIPITEFCDRNELRIPNRIELFITVSLCVGQFSMHTRKESFTVT